MMTYTGPQSPKQIKWVISSVSLCAYIIWPALAMIVALSLYDQSPSSHHFYWVGAAFAFAWGLHFFSRRSDKAYPVVLRELFIASFVQGGLIGVVNIQLMPSIAIICTTCALLIVGSWQFYIHNLLVCVSGFLTYWLFFGVKVNADADFYVNVFAILMILLLQALYVILALRHYELFNAEQGKQADMDYIDASTGLKTIHYFYSLIEEGEYHHLKHESSLQDKQVNLALYLVRMDLFEQTCQGQPPEFSNKLLAEFTYRIFDLMQAEDLVIKWQEDLLLILCERDKSEDYAALAQSMVTQFQHRSVMGVPLTASVIYSIVKQTASDLDTAFWYTKLDFCYQAMAQGPSQNTWQYIES